MQHQTKKSLHWIADFGPHTLQTLHTGPFFPYFYTRNEKKIEIMSEIKFQVRTKIFLNPVKNF